MKRFLISKEKGTLQNLSSVCHICSLIILTGEKNDFSPENQNPIPAIALIYFTQHFIFQSINQSSNLVFSIMFILNHKNFRFFFKLQNFKVFAEIKCKKTENL